MHLPARRLPAIVLLFVLVASLAPVAVVSAASEAQLDAAEATVASKLNAERASRGLVALRVDSRLADLARERAVYMAEHDVLSHTHAGGQAVWDLMTDRSITWYRSGEIIAYNGTSNLNSSASGAASQWMHSAPHKAIAMSKDYNYVGFGVAISTATGRRYWAGVYLKGPDRTGAWVKILSAGKQPIDSRKSRVTIRWDGDDVKLSTLTSGLKHYVTGYRVDGGPWHEEGTRTSESTVRTWTRGHVYQFKIRAVDKAGNLGSWRTTTVRP
jgi:uncharacterized protein YkwD